MVVSQMKMPENHPNTNHIDPYWLSDSPKGIRMARKAVPRGRACFKDLNLQALLDDDGFIHWATARKNGYHYIQVRPFKRRHLTEYEMDLLFKHWRAKKFKRLRRTKRAGVSYASRAKPMLYRRGINICVRNNVIPCVELKSPEYIYCSRVSRLIHPIALFMALFKMSHCLKKGQAVISSGGQFAILAHKEKRPIGLVKDYNYTEIWGRFT
jgi:hypothetical protein